MLWQGEAARRWRVSELSSPACTPAFSSLYWIKLKHLRDGFSMNLFREEVAAYQVTFSPAVPMLTFKGSPLKCLNNY